ncbi:MAG TPA: DUF58 domain-containing protein [Planctomycetota bacterium]|jgi:uncharacterized protein (DUF58 family)|nr:DUF58 domain-containing protein [Planctomycetota bacterium]
MAFDAGFLKTLEALNLLARRTLTGDDRAERLTPRKGASLEFADYRRYTPGDEIRYIDWNVYARHGNLFVKEFTAEENIHVSVLLDTSRSMEFGGKFQAAKELAAALGYIGLANYDTLSLFTFGSEVRPVKKFLRGKGRVFELLSAVDAVQTEGVTDMRRAFGPALPRLRGRSLILLVTDFYDLAGYSEGIRELLAQRFGVHLIHMVAREEMTPQARGRFSLLDLETGRTKDATLLPRTVEAYSRRFRQFCSEVEEFGRAHELAYARILADEPLERRVIEILRAGGILEHR